MTDDARAAIHAAIERVVENELNGLPSWRSQLVARLTDAAIAAAPPAPPKSRYLHGVLPRDHDPDDCLSCWDDSPAQEECLAAAPPERKVDGWHTYHVCGGVLRELTWADGQVLCAVCGEWFDARGAISR